MLLFFNLLFPIYSSIAIDFSFRINNETGWFGPKTRYQSQVGKIKFIKSDEDLNSLNSTVFKDPQVLFLPFSMMSIKNLRLINYTFKPIANLVAVAVYNRSSDTSADFSFLDKNPLSRYDDDSTSYEWNPTGEGTLYEVFNFPIIYCPDQDEYPIESPAVNVQVEMDSRLDIKHCLEKERCDPIGGYSLYGAFKNNISDNSNLGNKSVWLVTGIDSFGLIPYAHKGARYSLSGLVTALAVLESLDNEAYNWSNTQTPLRFLFLDAEEVGYMGSTRFFYSLTNPTSYSNTGSSCGDDLTFDCKFAQLTDSSFAEIIELKSVGGEDLTMYTMSSSSSGLYQTAKSLGIGEGGESMLPPSSMRSIYRFIKDSDHIVITDYKNKAFSTNYYGTPFDNELNSSIIKKNAETIAKLVLTRCNATSTSSPTPNPDPEINESFIDGLIEGFLNTPDSSSLFKEILSSFSLPTSFVSLYSGPISSFKTKHYLIKYFLESIANSSSPNSCESDSDCGSDEFCAGYKKICSSSNVYSFPAYSMNVRYNSEKYRFEYYNSNLDIEVANLAETVWTETLYSYVNYTPYATLYLAVGFVVTVALFILGGFIWSNFSTTLAGN